MAPAFAVSVNICAHNPREDYFRRVIEALRRQSPSTAEWELLLIGNASVVPLVCKWDLLWHPNARHIREEQLGVAVARRRGMREASADLLIFVDDDNVLADNYLSDAVTIKNGWPLLGVWGSGTIIPEYERQPSEYVSPIVSYLALRECSSSRWTNVFPCMSAPPWGAGMSLRANVAHAYCQFCENSSLQISSRRGNSVLMSGEDVETCYVAACDLGCGKSVFPQLKLTHLIPKERVTTEYLFKVFGGTDTSNFLLEYKRTGSIPQSPLRAEGILSVLKNLLTKRGLQRRMYPTTRARHIIAESQAHGDV